MLLLNRRDFVTCLIFVTFVSGEYYNHSETNNHCVDLKPQTTLDMDQVGFRYFLPRQVVTLKNPIRIPKSN